MCGAIWVWNRCISNMCGATGCRIVVFPICAVQLGVESLYFQYVRCHAVQSGCVIVVFPICAVRSGCGMPSGKFMIFIDMQKNMAPKTFSKQMILRERAKRATQREVHDFHNLGVESL